MWSAFSLTLPSTAPSTYGMVLACRFWLIFRVIRTSSDSGGETCSATRIASV